MRAVLAFGFGLLCGVLLVQFKSSDEGSPAASTAPARGGSSVLASSEPTQCVTERLRLSGCLSRKPSDRLEASVEPSASAPSAAPAPVTIARPAPALMPAAPTPAPVSAPWPAPVAAFTPPPALPSEANPPSEPTLTGDSFYESTRKSFALGGPKPRGQVGRFEPSRATGSFSSGSARENIWAKAQRDGQ